MKIPGILGGLGPDTTARIYLALAIVESKEYPGLLISNVAFPKYLEEEIVAKGKDCKLILPYILKSIQQLHAADFIVMPCNTLHTLLPELRKNCSIPFLDLIEEARKEIKQKYRKVGILCTTKTRQERLYDDNLEGVEIIYPTEDEQKLISEIIVRIIRNEHTQEDKQVLEGIIRHLIVAGAEKVILACTDLANLITENEDVLDSTDILIRAIQREMASKTI